MAMKHQIREAMDIANTPGLLTGKEEGCRSRIPLLKIVGGGVGEQSSQELTNKQLQIKANIEVFTEEMESR